MGFTYKQIARFKAIAKSKAIQKEVKVAKTKKVNDLLQDYFDDVEMTIWSMSNQLKMDHPQDYQQMNAFEELSDLADATKMFRESLKKYKFVPIDKTK